MGSVSNGYGDTHHPPRTLAGATILQIVPVLSEGPVARTAINVAYALLQSGARALIAAKDGPLVAELQAFGGEWVPLENETINPFKLRSNARALERLIAAERVDIVHAQSIGGAWSANKAASQIAVWLVTTLPDVPVVSGLRALSGQRARARGSGDHAIELRSDAGHRPLRSAARAAHGDTAQHRHRRLQSCRGRARTYRSLAQGLAD